MSQFSLNQFKKNNLSVALNKTQRDSDTDDEQAEARASSYLFYLHCLTSLSIVAGGVITCIVALAIANPIVFLIGVCVSLVGVGVTIYSVTEGYDEGHENVLKHGLFSKKVRVECNKEVALEVTRISPA